MGNPKKNGSRTSKAPVKKSIRQRVTPLEELAELTPVAAIGEVSPPPKTESVLTIRATERPDFEVKQVGPDRWSVHIKPPASSVQLGPPVKSMRRISLTELSHVATKMKTPEGYQPPWLSRQYLPRTIPGRHPPAFTLMDFGIHAGLHESDIISNALRRQQLAERGWPWCTVGDVGVFVGDHIGEASGVLVGPNLILTTSHVIPWAAPDGSWSMLFRPSYRATAAQPAPFGASWVEEVRGHATLVVNGRDYVIAKLHTPLGNTVGWMGSRSFDDDGIYEGSSWMSLGYPGHSGVPYWAPDVRIINIESDGDGLELETGDFLMEGWSGGPLFGFFGIDPYVIGIASGSETSLLTASFRFLDTHSVFAGGKLMVDLVKYGYANWPV